MKNRLSIPDSSAELSKNPGMNEWVLQGPVSDPLLPLRTEVSAALEKEREEERSA